MSEFEDRNPQMEMKLSHRRPGKLVLDKWANFSSGHDVLTCHRHQMFLNPPLAPVPCLPSPAEEGACMGSLCLGGQ